MSKKSCPFLDDAANIKIGHDFLDTWLAKVKSKKIKEERDRGRDRVWRSYIFDVKGAVPRFYIGSPRNYSPGIQFT